MILPFKKIDFITNLPASEVYKLLKQNTHTGYEGTFIRSKPCYGYVSQYEFSVRKCSSISFKKQSLKPALNGTYTVIDGNKTRVTISAAPNPVTSIFFLLCAILLSAYFVNGVFFIAGSIFSGDFKPSDIIFLLVVPVLIIAAFIFVFNTGVSSVLLFWTQVLQLNKQ